MYNNSVSSGIILLTCISLFCLSGCSTLAKVGLWEIDPKPEFGPPDSTGLVVVDCLVFYDKPIYNILDGGEVLMNLLEKAADQNQAFSVPHGRLEDGLGNSAEGTAFGVDWSGSEKLIVFPNLEPGVYRLSQLEVVYKYYTTETVYDHDANEFYEKEASHVTESAIDIPPDKLEELTFEALPGRPVYIGKLIIFDARGDGENEYQINNEPEHEIAALKRLM